MVFVLIGVICLFLWGVVIYFSTIGEFNQLSFLIAPFVSFHIGLSRKDFDCCPVCNSKKIKIKPTLGLGKVSAVSVCCKKCGATMSKNKSLYDNAVQQLKNSWNMRTDEPQRKLDENGYKSCPCCDAFVKTKTTFDVINLNCGKCGLHVSSSHSKINKSVSEHFKRKWNKEC